MNTKKVFCATLMTLLLLLAGLLWAQPQNVQITQAPSVQTSADSAVVTWSTNVPASAIVKYGTDRNSLSQTAQAPWGGTQHTVQLKNLRPGTYYYQVTSSEAQGTGTGAISNIDQFTVGGGSAQATPSSSSQNLQLLAGPIAQKPTPNSAQIWWETSTYTGSMVRYGTDPNNLSQTAEGGPGTSHYVALSNLQPSTKYYYELVNPQGTRMIGSAFLTPSAQEAQSGQFQINDGPYVERLSPTDAVVAWSTSRPSSSLVMYGTDPNNLNQRAEAPWGQTTHRVTVRNLQPDTQYFFEVQTGQAQGTGSEARSFLFQVHTLKQGEQAAVVKPR